MLIKFTAKNFQLWTHQSTFPTVDPVTVGAATKQLVFMGVVYSNNPKNQLNCEILFPFLFADLIILLTERGLGMLMCLVLGKFLAASDYLFVFKKLFSSLKLFFLKDVINYL